MNYNVIGPDGAVYGPVDEATLKQWVVEARVLPTTMLEEVGSGRRFEAKTMASLFPPIQPAPSQPAGPAQPSAPSVLHAGYEPPKTSTTGIGQVGPGGVNATAAAQRMGGSPGYTSSTAYAPIDNHLIKAVIALFLCLPLGVVALIFATQVAGKLEAGDRLGAQDSADKANLFSNIGLWIWAIGTFLCVGGYLVLVVFLAKNMGTSTPVPH